jgi:hypothetical protein
MRALPRRVLKGIHVGHDRHAGRKREERDFLQEHRPDPPGIRRRPRLLLLRAGCLRSGERHAAERPDVQQQQNERQGDNDRLGHETEAKQDHDEQIPAELRPLDIAHVTPQRQKPEESAENVLPLGYPSYGFDVQGVQRKQTCDECAWPAGPSHPLEQREQQQGTKSVQQQIDQMVQTGARSKELPAGHVRKPGQRKPVAVEIGGKRPNQAL